MNVKLSPGVVIEARNRMVAELSEFGGRPIPAATRADIADWLISYRDRRRESMSKLLRYDTATNHTEKITGRIIAHELSFEIEVGNGQYGVKVKQDQADSAIVVHGGTLPKLIEALQEIHALYCEAVARYQAATGEADNRGREGRSTEAGGE